MASNLLSPSLVKHFQSGCSQMDRYARGVDTQQVDNYVNVLDYSIPQVIL